MLSFCVDKSSFNIPKMVKQCYQTGHFYFNKTKIDEKCLNWKKFNKTFWVDKRLLKMPKLVNFGEFLKTWTVLPDRSFLIGQKLMKNAKIEKCDFSSNFLTLWIDLRQHWHFWFLLFVIGCIAWPFVFPPTDVFHGKYRHWKISGKRKEKVRSAKFWSRNCSRPHSGDLSLTRWDW